MVVVATVVYVNNVIVLPSLRAPDGFGHFTYIWLMASTGSVPWATEGWSFFHPPLYYALGDFLKSVTEKAPVVCSADEGVRAATVGILAHRAVVSGDDVAIKL